MKRETDKTAQEVHSAKADQFAKEKIIGPGKLINKAAHALGFEWPGFGASDAVVVPAH